VFIDVGKKLILQLACSILKVYNGVFDVRGLALTTLTKRAEKATPITAIDIFRFLFILITSIPSVTRV